MISCRGFERKRLILVAMLWLLSSIVGGKEQVSTIPFSEVFFPEQYGAHNQNWAVDFDQYGRVYFANNDGVLIFDGNSWQILKNFNLGIIRSVVVTDNQQLYVGGQSALGVYSADKNGNWQYKELSIPQELGDIGPVWNGLEHAGKVYFSSSKYLLIIEADGTISGLPSNEVVTIGKAGDLAWAYFQEKGLVDLNNINGSPLVPAISSPIVGIHQRATDLLLISRNGTLNHYTGAQHHSGTGGVLSTISNDFPNNLIVMNVSDIPGGIAISSFTHGLFVIDTQGKLLHHIQQDSFGALDAEYANGNLWVAIDGAIQRLPWPILLEKFLSPLVLKNKVQSIARYHNGIYLGTNRGLYLMQDHVLTLVQDGGLGAGATAWDMARTSAGLLVVTGIGSFLINEQGVKPIIGTRTRGMTALHTPANHYLITSFISGTYLVKITEDSADIVYHQDDLKLYTTNMVQDDQGNIFIGTRSDGLYRLQIKPDNSFQVEHMGVEVLANGNQGDPYSSVFLFQDEIRQISHRQVCQPIFEPTLQCAVDKGFSADLGLSQYIDQQREQNYYFVAEPTHTAIIQANANGAIRRLHSNFDELPKSRLNQILVDDDSVWLARRDGLWRYWPQRITPSNIPKVWVQSILSGSHIIYQAARQLERIPHVIGVENNSLRFSFASNVATNSHYQLWRAQLMGYEGQYSEWSSENWKDYTQLPGGDYHLLVQLKDRSGRVSEPTSIHFAVAYPWYLSLYAKILYAILSLLLVMVVSFLFSRHRITVLKRKQLELEQTVQQRTQQIAAKNKTLAEQAEKLTELDQSKSRFFANITHEFRTPLTLTIGPLQDTLAGRYGELNDKTKRALSLAKNRSEELLSLVEELLDIARLDAGALPLHGQSLNIVEACKHTLAQLDSWAQAKNIDLSSQFDCQHPMLVADPKQLSKVITNLLGNAIKFTPENGKVSLTLQDDDNFIYIKITDTGPGISEVQMKHIFERFHQVGSNKNISLGGVGLGLSLANEITIMHGGNISVESVVGQGACFILKLPKMNELLIEGTESPPILSVSKARAVEVMAHTPTNLDNSNTQQTLLIVEDDADLRNYIAEHFADHFSVICSSNGDAGLIQARKMLPDLIISDVMMPIMDGMELCQKLKQDPETDFIPIILLTARVDDSDKIDGFDVGADDYLAKPFNADVLKSRVANLIESRRKLLAHTNDAHVIFPTPEGLINREQHFVEKLQLAIKSGLSDSHFSVEKLAEKMHMERSTLYKKTQNVFAATPSELLINARLKWACQLLQSDSGNIAEIAFTVGYNNVAYFSQSFKKNFAQTPSQYRQQQQINT